MQAKKVLALFDVDQTLTVARTAVTQEMRDTLAKMRAAGVDFGIVSGSDLVKVTEQLGEDLVAGSDWCFAENGLYASKKGQFMESQSLEKFLGKEKLDALCDFCQAYIDKLEIPVKTSVHVERRNGMINVSPVGRACSREQRNEYEAFDKETQTRAKFIEVLKDKFSDYGLRYSIGGQISFDVFPLGWDKSFCLKFVESSYDEIHFWGDKCYEGGNDHEIYKDPRTIGHEVANPEQTVQQLVEVFKL